MNDSWAEKKLWVVPDLRRSFRPTEDILNQNPWATYETSNLNNIHIFI